MRTIFLRFGEYRHVRDAPLDSLVDEAYHGIRGDVAHVHLFAVFLHRRMMLHHQPADVREEEAAISVMRIRASVRESVMRSVDADPFGWMSLQNGEVLAEKFLETLDTPRSLVKLASDYSCPEIEIAIWSLASD